MVFFKKRKLRIDILTIFLTLFLCTIAGIIYYSQTRSNSAILKVADHLIQRTNQAIVKRLDEFLRPASFGKISSFFLSDNLLQRSEEESLSSFMQIMLQSYPQLINTYLADTQGNLFVENKITQDPAAQKLIPFISTPSIPKNASYLSESLNDSKLTSTYRNEKGKILQQEMKEQSYDPRTRPWFIGAKKNLTPWIGLYSFYGTNQQVITIAFPIFSHNNFAGVAAADLSVDMIARELQKFSLSNQGVFFIVHNNTHLITGEQKDGLPLISEIHNPLITAALEEHKKTGSRHFIFSVQNETFIAHFTPYEFSDTEDWEIVSIMPTDLFVGSLDEANRNILFFSIFMLLLGIALIAYSSHRISHPIIKLAKETKHITQLRFEKETKIETHIYEVQIMIDALNTMKAALSSFAKYVPKALVEQLLQSRMIAELGGEKRRITALFTDIANFTELSERLEPEFLMLHLSEYLNALTRCIQDYRGNIDKYIGDAIMAFWGAPIQDEEQTFHACQAVLACLQKVRELNREWQTMGKPILPTRFGLNTGLSVVGNMGSSDRLNYTAIGDAINLAARLETLNKIYNTSVIVSESVYQICHSQFLFRPLDVVQVRGKKQTTVIYELVAGLPDAEKFAPTKQQIELCELTRAGYDAYHQEDYQKAQDIFKKINELFPEDEVAQIYLARCEDKI